MDQQTVEYITRLVVEGLQSMQRDNEQSSNSHALSREEIQDWNSLQLYTNKTLSKKIPQVDHYPSLTQQELEDWTNITKKYAFSSSTVTSHGSQKVKMKPYL